MKTASAWPALLVVALLGSGCMGTGAKTAPASAPPTAAHDDATGGVEGLVRDDEFKPISGANLAIIGVNQSARTGDDGRFAFSKLAPADYLMTVNRTGYFDRQVGFSVPVAAVAKIDVVLAAIPPPLPYADAGYRYTGFMRGAYSYRVASVSGNNSGYDAAAAPEAYRSFVSGEFKPQPGWRTILIEVSWDPPAPSSDELALQVTFPKKLSGGAVSSADTRWVTGGLPPIRWRIEREQLEAMGPDYAFDTFYGFHWRVGPSTASGATTDYSFHVEKKYVLYATIGYNGPLDGNFTRLPPG
ncbi:MAG: carboxypeptidase regulatory-like domain-containing protein [Euryarchaeota archaeon]|nr:carboxypeptidase regulatory-like domain-containing protein [Euryarchaeota archaeon]